MEDIPGHDSWKTNVPEPTECNSCDCPNGERLKECWRGGDCGCHNPEDQRPEEETLVGLHKKLQEDLVRISESVKKLVGLTTPPTPKGKWFRG